MGEVKQLVPADDQPRDHHHRVAVLVGTGKRVGEIASITGMSVQRISYLRTRPWFKELVEVYRDKAIAIEMDVYKEAVTLREHLHMQSARELRDRLEENPEAFSVRDLLEIYGDTADRMGMGKVQRNESVSLNVDLADSLAEARRRELQLSASASPDAEGAGHRTQGPAPA